MPKLKDTSLEEKEQRVIPGDIFADNFRDRLTGKALYTREEIDYIIETIRKGQYVVVDTEEYPTLEDFLSSDGEQGTVYLYPVGNQANNYYQYVWETGDWISLGTTDLDLSGYIKGEYLTQAEYDALATKDPNKYYFIPEGE